MVQPTGLKERLKFNTMQARLISGLGCPGHEQTCKYIIIDSISSALSTAVSTVYGSAMSLKLNILAVPNLNSSLRHLENEALLLIVFQDNQELPVDTKVRLPAMFMGPLTREMK